MGADGSIIIDTRIDTKNLDAGVVSTEKALKRLKTSVDETGKSINTAFSAKNAEGLSDSVSEESEKIKAILENTEKSAKSKAAQIAAIYRKQGMSQSDAFKKAWEQIERTSDTGSKKVKKHLLSISNTSNRVVSALKRIGAVIGTVFAVREIFNFGKEASKAAREASDSMMGLRSILEGQGRSFSDAKKFIDEYIQDGLIPMTDATAAYKNLASRGYDDTQIQQVMTALKDASAYGRQASYSMGDAVKSATEGLKNENSVLVDNAGVTKNVAKMWEDYARSIGTTSQNLTQQQKIQAEVTGILEETRFQTGDAARVAGTLTGEIQRLSFGFNNFKVAVGNIVNPILKTFLPVINAALTAITKFANTVATAVNNFFGTEMNMIADTANNTANSYDSMADSADNYADSTKDMADATKEAQKANKGYLSGLDDIKKFTADNKTTSTTTSTKTPAASTSTSTGIETLPKKTNSVLSQVETGFSNFATKVKGFMEPLTTQIERFAGIAKSAFTWFFENVLKPLGSWVVNEALPRFFQTLGSVLEIVNNVLEALKPSWKWLWDNVLEKIAKWTGGKFLEIWDKINEGLAEFAKWCKENPQKIKKVIVVITSFFAAFKFAKLISDIAGFIKTIGGISGIMKTVGGLATTAFSHPIALAIAAVVAAGVLVWQNWDAIKAKGKEIWNSITSYLSTTWNNIKTNTSTKWNEIKTSLSTKWSEIKSNASATFTNIKNNVSNAWSETKTKTATLWGNIKTDVSNVWSNLKSKASSSFSGIKTTVNNAWESIKDKASSSWSTVSSKVGGVLTSISTKASNMGTTIRNAFVNAFTGIVSMIKSPVNSIISFINAMIRGVVGGINLILQAFNKLKIDIPDWVPIYGGKTISFNFRTLTAPQIPYLAKGAVIPPNAPFMAMLGDQKHGTNIEAPLSTIEEALENVLMRQGATGGNNGGSYRFTAQINRRTLFDEMIDEAKMRQMQTGRNPFEFA